MSSKHPFETEAFIDDPGIVGAVWWNTSLGEASATRTRRAVLIGGGAAVALVAVGAALVSAASGSGSAPAYHEESRKSLDMQREYGWNFGSPEDNLSFGAGVEAASIDAHELAQMARDLEPVQAALLPFYVPTLFQSLEATPKTTPPDGVTSTVSPLRTVIRPILTLEMNRAEAIGRKLAEFLQEVQAPVAVVVDLPGPAAVAFAAGMCRLCEVVFLFDNWPHPKGVVPAHLTLAAAVHYQRVFTESKVLPSRMNARHTVFVLDSARLSPYTNDAMQFDNRYLAKLPGSEAVGKRGTRYVLHVVQKGSSQIEEDVASSLRAWSGPNTEVRLLPTSAFTVSGFEATFGGSAKSDDFFSTYTWNGKGKKRSVNVTDWTMCEQDYPRNPPASATPQSAAVGVVPVIVGGAGLILGAKMLSGGSWGRADGSGWGGG